MEMLLKNRLENWAGSKPANKRLEAGFDYFSKERISMNLTNENNSQAESIFMESSSELNEDERANTQENNISQTDSTVKSPMKRRRNESKIWDHCIVLADGSKKCNVEFCSQKWKASTGNSNIIDHLEKYHSFIIRPKNSNEQTAHINENTQKHNTVDQNKRTKALLEYIVESFQSFSIAFLKFCFLMDNRYVVPERHTISRLLDNEFENSIIKLKALISSLDSLVNLSTDGWVSLGNEPYMTVNCFFIDNELVKKKFVLDFFIFPYPHDGLHICDSLKKTLNEFDLNYKVLLVLEILEPFNQSTLDLSGDNYNSCNTEKESSSNLKDKPLSIRSSTELVQYLNAPRVDNIPGFDAILWWSKSSFHYLKKIAKDYLGVTPSSVPSEQTFSAAGLTITKDRTSLSSNSCN
ncbi:zinc finger BED domain-containing 1-like [Brachionus plicatilis]|uniref:Zinc finger BED domain-containing 1-like n=1 Tax=Brachionus plicatilis TaxID=10195 RepID=A0A3M7S1Q7_BRAPC|nr:zinc finger BED domain-containing 1-like [Brachionus plicatilis]